MGYEEKYKENRTNFKGWIDLYLVWKMSHPEACCTEKKTAISVQPLLKYEWMKIMFSLYKYTLAQPHWLSLPT